MTTMTSTSDTPLAQRPMTIDALPDLAEERLADEPAWLATLRREAIERFRQRGLPTRRDEEWRLINLRTLEQNEFALDAGDVQVGPEQLERFLIPGSEAIRIVFVNGRLDPALSTTDDVPEGLTVQPLSAAIQSDSALVREHLGRQATDPDDPFSALNTALFRDGGFVHAAKDVQIEKPVHLVNVTTDAESATLTNPRCLVVGEPGCKVNVIESYVALTDRFYLTNAVTEIVVGETADVHHYMIERESDQAYNINTLNVHQVESSRFSSHSVLFGGAVVRNNVRPKLDGENIWSLLNGVYLGAAKQYLDNHMRVIHAKPNCESRQYYKGLLAEKSQGVFTGRIIVEREAQKTDAIQSNENLLLSENARANAQPQLEIYADDVRCTHGATIGELDEEALFYLESRGVPSEEAKGMLIYAFVKEALDRMELEPVRRELESLLVERVPSMRAAVGDDLET